MPEFDASDPSASLEVLSEQMKQLDGLTAQFGRTLSRSLTTGIAQGRGFQDILRGIGQRLIDLALRSALKPLETGLGSALSGLFKGVSGLFSGGAAGAPLDLATAKFAEGGVINAPTFFPLGRGLGLAGERGAEAILPLARGPDGRLGVAASGQGGMNIIMNISTPDAESFRRAEAQVSAALARAVARGQRNL